MRENNPPRKELLVIGQFIIFMILQISFIPLVIIAFAMAYYREIIVSRKLGVSSTAVRILQCRWFMHYFSSREDEPSVKLVKAIHTESHYGLLGFMGAAIIAHRICGYSPPLGSIPRPGRETMLNFVNSRTVYFDRIMEKNVDQVSQVVIMGAGFDLRVLKYTKGKNVRVFELDRENIQSLKIKALEKAGIPHDRITFIPLDFNRDSWIEKLTDYGFDTSKKTFFLWEGVTIYLEEKVVRETLKTAASSSPAGSVIAFDFYTKALITGEAPLMLKLGGNLYKMTGEEFRFGIDFKENPRREIENLLKEAGLVLREFRLMGKTTKKTKPFGGLVEAVKK